MLVFGFLFFRQLGLQAQLTDVFGRRHFTESPVRPTLVVLDPPSFNLLPGIGQRCEPMCVQAFIA
ncbi:hypothetical protein WJ55_07015 [Burkholderia ubonensis]|nr:hypothetical protein WI82_07485 [Burkholderia ubonensis]KVG70254.1 hypothetical protein WJ34_27135 [Burkholderia ubonensis]KVH26270.1 hypothetical protein WJ37_05670 [Burkholderia ubonensis]KVH86915.1 hypothetical protein WJ43_03940 [Burkholderia ubonensis]KVM38522.1 hypothetical protein WJ55_07015 [Burkholderia ubonensis]